MTPSSTPALMTASCIILSPPPPGDNAHKGGAERSAQDHPLQSLCGHVRRHAIVENYVRWQLLGMEVHNACDAPCRSDGMENAGTVDVEREGGMEDQVEVAVGGRRWTCAVRAWDGRYARGQRLQVGVNTGIRFGTADGDGGKGEEAGGEGGNERVEIGGGGGDGKGVGGYEKQRRYVDATLTLFAVGQQCEDNDNVGERGLDILPTGLLIYGAAGTGKSHVVRSMLRQWRDRVGHDVMQILDVRSSDLNSRVYGKNESVLRGIFDRAFMGANGGKEHGGKRGRKRRELSVVVIDDLELICPSQSNFDSRAVPEHARRLVTALLALMDRVERHNAQVCNRCKVLVIGITSHLSRVDLAVQRPGRFDREVEFDVPSVRDRKQILHVMFSQMCNGDENAVTDNDLDGLVEFTGDKTHGFVASDLRSLCQEMLMTAMTRAGTHSNKSMDLTSAVQSLTLSENDTKSKAVITLHDIRLALTKIKPSAIREVLVEVPHVKWTDIGGQEEAKQLLREAVEWQIKHKESFERMGIRPPKGILLYGPPGCSKTMMAKALATEAGLNFLAVRGPELFSKWVGDSEKAVREVFRKARSAKPSIIFFDEIDGLAMERDSGGASSGVGDRVLSQLLNELDGMDRLEGVTVVAATNRPDLLDRALLRPGRIDRQLYVRIPDTESRLQILHIHLSKVSHECLHEELLDSESGSGLNSDALRIVAEATEGYSGAEMSALCREASYLALQENIEAPTVRISHILQAKAHVKPRLNKKMLDFYEQYYQSKKRVEKR